MEVNNGDLLIENCAWLVHNLFLLKTKIQLASNCMSDRTVPPHHSQERNQEREGEENEKDGSLFVCIWGKKKHTKYNLNLL